jgi:hypothetical protein
LLYILQPALFVWAELGDWDLLSLRMTHLILRGDVTIARA